MKTRFRFKITTLMLITVFVAIMVLLAMNSKSIVERFRYGKQVDVTEVRCVGINGENLKIEVRNQYYWSEESEALRDFVFLSLSGKELPDIQIKQAWQWNSERIYLKIGNQVVQAERVGAN